MHVGRDLEAQYHEAIYQLTLRDGLTQVYVRRFLLEALEKEILRARRHGRSLCVLMIEVDACQGSSEPRKATDHVLKEVARILRPFAPRDGILARHGHERFAMVLPEYTLERACAVAKSLRDEIANSPLTVGLGDLRATVCIGCVRQRDDDRAGADMLRRASLALHVAKGRGRSQVACDAIDEGPGSGPDG